MSETDRCTRCDRPVPAGDRLCGGCDDQESEDRQALHEWREETRRGEDDEP